MERKEKGEMSWLISKPEKERRGALPGKVKKSSFAEVNNEVFHLHKESKENVYLLRSCSELWGSRWKKLVH